MPLALRPRDVDPLSSTPKYRQVADRIREAIAGHELAPGEVLPPEKVIAKTLEVSVTTVSEAMDVLVGEGLIVSRRAAGNKVADRPQVRRLDASRYRRELDLLRADGDHPKTSAFAHEHGATWADVEVDANYDKEFATQADADYLGVEPDAPIMRRRLLKWISGQPLQMQRSAIPYDIAAGTPLEDPTAQPYPGGTIAELWDAGLVVARVSEDIWSRMPSADERQLLRMEVVGPVWDIVRVFSTTERAVEASRVIAPANRNVLHYETDLSVTD